VDFDGVGFQRGSSQLQRIQQKMNTGWQIPSFEGFQVKQRLAALKASRWNSHERLNLTTRMGQIRPGSEPFL
jgi:hypothetical protein